MDAVVVGSGLSGLAAALSVLDEVNRCCGEDGFQGGNSCIDGLNGLDEIRAKAN